MKKLALCLFFALLICGFLFSETKWYKGNEVDDFGDPTGRFSVYTDYLSGTYKNKSTSNGSLKYRLEVKDDGSLLIYLFEDGKSKDLTTTSSGLYYVNTNEQFKIQIKYGNGEIKYYYITGLKKDDNYNYDLIYVSNWRHDFRYDLINESELKIVISASNGSYSLGSIDTSVITGAVFFDSTLYDEGIKLMGQGRHSDAINKFEEMRSKDKDAFDFYKTVEKITECEQELGKQMYNEAKALMDSGEYQNAFIWLVALKTQYPEVYKSLNANELMIDTKEKEGGLYEVGDKGPAGGVIFYDCDADNELGNPDGLKSSECGWRYLEVAPSDIHKNYSGTFCFGCYRKTLEDDDRYVSGYTEYDESNCTLTAIGAGKRNTELLVNSMGNTAYCTQYFATETLINYAAKLCADYSYGGFDDWFLPSRDELNLMCVRQADLGCFDFSYGDDYYYWSSSEVSGYADRAWMKDFSRWDWYYGDRNSFHSVRPVRSF